MKMVKGLSYLDPYPKKSKKVCGGGAGNAAILVQCGLDLAKEVTERYSRMPQRQLQLAYPLSKIQGSKKEQVRELQ